LRIKRKFGQGNEIIVNHGVVLTKQDSGVWLPWAGWTG